ncbi:hypothetical protein [Rhizobium etli]|uniref:hypothetical protein n=1 Tax=Rhizobium etli TaxID=29449 RepID=UPI0012BBEFE8|nr:hypothetical protein [Rhizobium etli]
MTIGGASTAWFIILVSPFDGSHFDRLKFDGNPGRGYVSIDGYPLQDGFPGISRFPWSAQLIFRKSDHHARVIRQYVVVDCPARLGFYLSPGQYRPKALSALVYGYGGASLRI